MKNDLMLWSIITHTVDPWTLTLLFVGATSALGLDFPQRPVNVQWESGLAVEFFDKDNGEF